jgi:hypothetical protein
MQDPSRSAPIHDLATLLRTLSVAVAEGEWCVVSLESPPTGIEIRASVAEAEGTSYVISTEAATHLGIEPDFVGSWLTLGVNSALNSVGLTAQVASALAQAGIPCNVFAGYHHDHLLVPSTETERAVATVLALRIAKSDSSLTGNVPTPLTTLTEVTNRLAHSTSAYLRQHAENPVDWYPWGDEAFEEAERLDRPVFISIGYAACHWCHVMAHESFEDPATAAMLNERFISIKVDREEHPDVDAIYMEAVQSMTGSGGWPMTIFCDHDRRPFFGGTYFPKTANHGMPAFTSLLEAVATAWVDKRAELSRQSDELIEAIASRIAPPQGTSTRPEAISLVKTAVDRFTQIYDPDYGGVGNAPKFPQAPMLELLLRAQQMGNAAAGQMVEHTLAAMASGGIYDQLGGGFARYSVDRSWTIPHFEKMLYDQAALARLYLHAYQTSGDPRWRQVCEETLDYVLRDLSTETGGLASAEDADSEGEEGRFYVWTAESASHALDVAGYDGDVEAVLSWYGLDLPANFEHGTSALIRARRGDLIRPDEIESARVLLLAARNTRVRPGLVDNVLTEWNAMAISVLAEAGSALGEERFLRAAVELGDFLVANLRREDGRWLRAFQGGRAAHLGVATDYAWLTDAFTRLGEATGEAKWLDEAKRCAADLIRIFSAPDGGFFLSGEDSSGLPVRARDSFDGVLPGAVSMATGVLVRLGSLLSDEALIARAEQAVDSSSEALVRAPLALAHLIGSIVQLEFGALELVVGAGVPDLLASVRGRYLPDAVLLVGERTDSPLWEEKADGFVYVCRGGVCLAPVADLDALDTTLASALSSVH